MYLYSHLSVLVLMSLIIREGARKCNFFHSCNATIGCENCSPQLLHFETATALHLEVSLTPLEWVSDFLLS